MKIIIIVFAFLAFAVSLNAQWTNVNTSTTTKLDAIAVTDANTVYTVGGEPPNAFINLKTTNGGLNWTTFASSSNGGVSVYFIDANTGFLQSINVIQRTTNAGNNWTTVYTASDTVIFIQFHFPNANTGYGVGMTFLNGISIAGTAAIKTTNGGLNWTRFAPPISGIKVLQSVYFTDVNTGYAVGLSSPQMTVLIKTTNGGYSWNSICPVYSGSEMYSVKFTDENTGYVCGSSGIGILKTTNAGVTWNQIYPNLTNDICFITANTGFAISSNGIVRTNNAGVSWITQNSTVDLLQIRFSGNYIGYACGKNGVILKTTNGGSVFVSNISNEIPSAYSLLQNYPNPFNPATNIRYQIANNSFVSVKIYDVLGRNIETLVNEKQNAGTYEVTFDGTMLTSGVYFCKIQSGDFSDTKKMLMLK